MSWQKHLKVISIPMAGGDNSGTVTGSNFSSYLPELYSGHPGRIQRYAQYDEMDRDSTINSALNIISDFCTQSEEQADKPFSINYSEDATETEIMVIKKMLAKWIKSNKFKSRLWYIVRGVLKNGDQFFIRDPETGEWNWVDHHNIEMVKIDSSDDKTTAFYYISNLDYNTASKVAAVKTQGATVASGLTKGMQQIQTPQGTSPFMLPGAGMEKVNAAISGTFEVSAEHIIHLSLNPGVDSNWPFGTSVLESVFKTYKQKELLEDSVVIYRMRNAPERRVFKIDVGELNPVQANAHIDKVKNDMNQKRIPNRNGKGGSIVDAAYNPLSMMEDYFFAVGSEGRGSSVELLQSGAQTGEIGDLEFFDKKLQAGLQIPAAYMPGSDGTTYQDGKVGAAMIQEFLFNKYCLRIQSLLTPAFDDEFKKFLAKNGITIDVDLFDLEFNPPQNFNKYRQIELNSQQVSIYQQLSDNHVLAERFKLIKFLGLTAEEVIENERQWAEENPSKIEKATGVSDTESDASLGDIGVKPENSESDDSPETEQ